MKWSLPEVLLEALWNHTSSAHHGQHLGSQGFLLLPEMTPSLPDRLFWALIFLAVFWHGPSCVFLVSLHFPIPPKSLGGTAFCRFEWQNFGLGTLDSHLRLCLGFQETSRNSIFYVLTVWDHCSKILTWSYMRNGTACFSESCIAKTEYWYHHDHHESSTFTYRMMCKYWLL